jgi:hypothetical protein
MLPGTGFSNVAILAAAIGSALQIFSGCTDSPFDAGIAPETRSITGRVVLSDFADEKEGVYVWLEGVNIGTRTDRAGTFRLELPRELSQTGADGLNGVYRLYFYVANYAVSHVNVVVKRGLFAYGQADVTRAGQLKDPVNLLKILTIKTIVDPPWVPQSYDGPIDVQVTLRAPLDSVTVIFPKSVGGLLGGMFFRNFETGDIYIDIPDVGADTRETVVVGPEPKSRRQIFQLNGTNFRDLFLPAGEYQVIPFFFVQQEKLPPELVDSLGQDVDEPTPNYLEIPFRREGGQFRVVN